MKKLIGLGLVAALSLAALPSSAQTPPLNDSASSREVQNTARANSELVSQFYTMAFNQHRPREAARLFIGDRYIQHNPQVPNGAEPFYTYFEGHFREFPQSRATIHRVIADGDLVALHVHSQTSPTDQGVAIIDIFRVENGKIVEHWDVIQAVPETTANGNTMFSGTKAD